MMGEREEEGVRLVRFFENDRGDKLRHSKAMQPDWLRRFNTRLIALRTSAVSSYWQKKTNNQNKKSYLLNFSIPRGDVQCWHTSTFSGFEAIPFFGHFHVSGAQVLLGVI